MARSYYQSGLRGYRYLSELRRTKIARMGVQKCHQCLRLGGVIVAVNFGLFDHLDARQEPLTKTFAERLEFIGAAEQGGFHTYHLAEHHSTPLGMGPSPSVFLAAVAQATKQIRLGPLVYLLPLYNPLRLIEEICMLDHLSGGRFEVGVGRGVSPIELGFFGIDAEQSSDIAAEALAVIKQGLTSERLNHRGKYFRYDNVPMSIRPLQKEIPFWAASMSPQGLRQAATQGMNSALLGSCQMVSEAVATYRAALPGIAPGIRQGMLRLIVVSDTQARAETLAAAALSDWFSKLSKLWREYNVEAPLIGAMGDYEVARSIGALVVGTPESVSDSLAAQVSETGVNYLLAQMAFGNLPHTDEMRSLELFIERVLPNFQ